MKIGIAKPDYGAAGGFEIVVGRVADGLRRRGHAVDLVQVDGTGNPTSHLPIPVADEHVELFREFFFHLNMVAKFEALDVSAYDAVLCTWPCSYAVRHPRKVVLFYHHTRSFYDLQPVFERVRGHDLELHRLAAFIVRDIDTYYLTSRLPILAGSRRVKQRLADYNHLVDNVEVWSAGLDEAFLDSGQPAAFESPICVGRHEFPKRTELFLHALQHVDGLEGRVIGAGSFTDRLEGVDAWLRLQHAAGGDCRVQDERLWRHDTIHRPLDELRAAQTQANARALRPAVRFVGRVTREELLREYASALCVVCPAFDEDFGLTCLEAMACGKPVIACTDGGGYVELIDDGVDGFVVKPTGPAIAHAIERLKDRDLARAMGERGRQKARAYTWPRAVDHVERALQSVL
jgi:glycosyltransferase involved in cell wall biosynthesis